MKGVIEGLEIHKPQFLFTKPALRQTCITRDIVNASLLCEVCETCIWLTRDWSQRMAGHAEQVKGRCCDVRAVTRGLW